ncbi:hypothetical protein DL1_10080 [Thioclava dalianensis]|uniref:RES domain-containing protein n=1 Tax=Thioclava dalianensis TaxID=1185766 RepID=A0A074TH00_9RHOB|nr:RES family NAD+ phosphorylase [Thioclava dalianensis]KEP70991.1 hypothetical protein DL1_10080 [Thioclava dalianensis]SFN27397.1 RES domain-containing protein [Thioclava dalianensis]
MISFHGPVWRILSTGPDLDARAAVRAPEGRFHHSGQTALYASLSAEGAGVALRRYVKAGDAPRIIVKLTICAERIFDLRGTDAAKAASVVWQDIRGSGAPAPTWTFSDRARAAGAQGMLYASRSRPDLSHLVLFDLSPGIVQNVGPAEPWLPPYPVPKG